MKITLTALFGILAPITVFGFDLIVLPNSNLQWNLHIGDSPEEKQSLRVARQDLDSREGKADRESITEIVSMFRDQKIGDFEKMLGKPKEIGNDYILPNSAHSIITVGNEYRGPKTRLFFPVEDAGGIYICLQEETKIKLATVVNGTDLRRFSATLARDFRENSPSAHRSSMGLRAVR